MRTFQLFVAFLTLFATTALADFYARGDDEGLSARDAWDDDVLFARHFDDELYARDFEEHKNHPLVRELVNIVSSPAGRFGTSRLFLSPSWLPVLGLAKTGV